MTLLESLQSVVDQMTKPVPQVIYDSWNKANIQLDGENYPVILIVQNVNGKFQVFGGSVSENLKTFIAFINKTEYEIGASENEAIISVERQRAREFISKYNNSGKFKPLTDVPFESFYTGKVDAPTTGVIIEFDCQPLFNYTC